MRLFNKKECCGKISKEVIQKTEEIKKDNGIKILGSGCTKCEKLEESVKQAITELNLDLPIEHITDFSQIAAYGVMSTPALVLNGQVISFGKALSANEVKQIILEKMKG